MAVAGGAAAGLRRPPRLTVVGRFADYSTVTVACIHGWIRHSNRCVPRLRVSTLIVRPGNRPSRRKTAGRPEAGSTAAHAGFGSGLPNSTWLISGMHPALKPVVLTSVNRRVWLAARGGLRDPAEVAGSVGRAGARARRAEPREREVVEERLEADRVPHR